MHVEGSASILALIELNHLTKTFKGKTQTVDALKDINLHIEQGDIFGIIGMSGAGKSTLVRCINFLEQPTSAGCARQHRLRDGNRRHEAPAD